MAVRHKMPYAAIESVLRATSSKIGDTSLYIWARTWRCKLYKDSTGAVYAKLSLNGSLNAVNHHANTRTSPNPTIRPLPRINCAGPSHLCLVLGAQTKSKNTPLCAVVARTTQNAHTSATISIPPGKIHSSRKYTAAHTITAYPGLGGPKFHALPSPMHALLTRSPISTCLL